MYLKLSASVAATMATVWLSSSAFADPTYKAGLVLAFQYQGLNTGLTGINDSGRIVGYYGYIDKNGYPTTRGLIVDGFSAGNVNPKLSFQKVALSPYKSAIYGISSKGAIAGDGCFPDPFDPPSIISRGLFGAIGSAYSAFPFVNGTFSVATGINARGEVTGVVSNNPGSSPTAGFILEPSGKMVSVALPGFEKASTTTSGINDASDVVGYVNTSTTETTGFIRSHGGTYSTVWPTVRGYRVISTDVNAINKHGDIVGDIEIKRGSYTATYPFLRTADGNYTLFQPGFSLNGIDSAGDIVATYLDVNSYSSVAIIVLPDPGTGSSHAPAGAHVSLVAPITVEPDHLTPVK